MPIQREFLGFEQPALWSAAQWLLDRPADGRPGNLGDLIVVVPGRSAARRLLEILLEEARQRGVALMPPEIETIGQLPERLYTPKLPFASNLVQQLAWTAALRKCEAECLAKIIARRPDEHDEGAWRSLGEMLRRQHTELAAEGLDFSHVAEILEELTDEEEAADEVDRWRALRQVQQIYLATLDGLEIWDKQSARLFAIEHREFAADKRIVLLGATDLSRAMRQMIDQVADRVTALVFAPAEWVDRFDDYGCVDTARWQEATIDLDDRQILVADTPADQACAVATVLAGLEGKRRPDEITIGMPDANLASQVQRQLEECGVATRWYEGRRLLETGPCRLLSALAAHLERDRYAPFAALVRHADVFDWMRRHACVGEHAQADLLALLDDLYMRHLPAQLDGELLQGDGMSKYAALVEAVACVERLVAPLRGGERRLIDWVEPIADTIREIYGERSFNRDDDRDRAALSACERLRDALLEHKTLPAELAPALSAAAAIRLTLEQLAGEQVYPRRGQEAVEMHGWFDLPWDDAPIVALTTFNDGFIPSSASADMFLPDSLRRRLGLIDNERRYARDAYALSALLRSREQTTLIVGRRDTEGGPLTPSRLLFAADPETIARRALRLFAPLPSITPSAKRRRKASESAFVIPRPMPLPEPITRLTVTSFRSYLACPYRFYLKHVLKLEACDDRAQELEPSNFGTFLHEVLDEFGRDTDINRSKNPDQIAAYLHAQLDRRAEKTFGKRRMAAIDVQLEQARQRLDRFAAWQAGHAAKGWRIIYAEEKNYKQDPSLVVDGQPILLVGRIDRIDLHERHGFLIVDYKSGDSGKKPDDVHRKAGKWVDLQLPLYRHLARFLPEVDGKIALGYILLPRDGSKAGLHEAAWTDGELAEADKAAFEVVRGVRKEKFWPPSKELATIGQEFGPICQDRLFGKRRYEQEEEEQAP